MFFSNRQKFVAFDYYSFQNVGWLTDCINMRNNSFLILRSSNNWSFEIRRKIQSLTGSTFRIVFYIGGVEKNHFRSVVWCIWIAVSFIQAVWIYMKCSLNWLEIMILIVTKLIKFNFAYKPFEDQKKIIISNFSYKNCDIVIKSNFFSFSCVVCRYLNRYWRKHFIGRSRAKKCSPIVNHSMQSLQRLKKNWRR